MIKHFVNWIKAWIGIKDEEMDPHAELYLKDKELDVPVYEEKTIHCTGHSIFRKSCPRCLEIVGVK